jgi:hypothetical protein
MADQMTVGAMRAALAHLPEDLPLLVHAEDQNGNEVFAGVRDVFRDGTCDGIDVVRIRADQDDTDA